MAPRMQSSGGKTLKKKRKPQQSERKRRSKDAAADDMHLVECGSLWRHVLVSGPQLNFLTQEAIRKKEQEQKQKEEAITYTVIA
jgi:hypothetical protein